MNADEIRRADLLKGCPVLGRVTSLYRAALLDLAEPPDDALVRIAATIRAEFSPDALRLGIALADQLREVIRAMPAVDDFAAEDDDLRFIAGLAQFALNLDRRLN